VYLVGFRTLREGTGDLPPIVTTLAIASMATAVGVIYLGSDPRQLTSDDFKGSLTVLGTPVAAIQAIIVVVALVIAALILLMVHRTTWGRRVRAISESARVAERAGIRVSVVVAQVFMVSGAIAGVGSYLWMIRVGSVSPFLGQIFLIKGLVIMVLGGLGRVGGAMAAGLLVGVLEGVSIAQFSGAHAELVTWAALIVVLLIRPQGLVRSAA
jgi:branched-chain amino acid transport system permease protein